MRVVRIAVAVALAASATAACAAVIGLEERPADPPRYCDTAEGSLFCDDFDDLRSDAGSKWEGYQAPIIPPLLVILDAGVEVTEPSLPSSPPRALAFSVERTSASAGAFLVHRVLLPPGELPGVVASVDVRIESLVALDGSSDPPDGSDAAIQLIYETPRLAVLNVIVPQAGTGSGAQLLISSEYVALATGSVLASRPDELVLVTKGQYQRLSALAWTRLTLAAGRPDAVRARIREENRAAECPDTPAVVAAWPSVGGDTAVCVRMVDEFANLADPNTNPTSSVVLAVGLGLGDPAVARVLVDTVRLDPLHE